ncbi:TPA: sigma-70 family RNA polymerase sigma factor [Streptococcus pyogenes]|nr:sigma-70 family RNA polymerase sigma factor [Streptococcus pyogenes]HES6895212.1 sigma-70 family RNA polymerase sigma factor [Streptococcus pyogenes]HES7591573.1 sigma-70 family RNA polymerase sigma factor [Streptococcus pyogenes]
MTDDRKYIYVKGKKIYVSDELYKAYKKQINHEAHLSRLDRKHKVYGFEDYKLDVNSIVDENVDIEKIIETKMRIEDLTKAIGKLNEEERELIYAIYFEEKTLKDIANTHDTNLMKISRIRDKILRKLRDMLDR